MELVENIDNFFIFSGDCAKAFLGLKFVKTAINVTNFLFHTLVNFVKKMANFGNVWRLNQEF